MGFPKKITAGVLHSSDIYFEIVRRYNSHDALVEALRLLVAGCEKAVRAGLVQPQVNGGLILGRAALEKEGK